MGTGRHSISEFGAVRDGDDLSKHLFDVSLGNVPRRSLVTIDLGVNVDEAIAQMNAERVGCVLVVDDRRLVGVFTERDLLSKVVGAKRDPATTPLADVMTPDPTTLPNTASIAYALHHMSVEGYRHLPLVDEEGRPTGVVAMRDIITWMVELFPESLLNLPPSNSPISTSVDGG